MSVFVPTATHPSSFGGKRKRTFEDADALTGRKTFRPCSTDVTMDEDTPAFDPSFYLPQNNDPFTPSLASQLPLYPAVQPYPNQRPLVFTPGPPPNAPPFTFGASSATTGLLQPTSATGDSDMLMDEGESASAVERVRMQHGPACSSIPTLKLADHPGLTGQRAMFSICRSCGACQQVA